MTRFLALVALGLAMTLAPTPGKAQQVPDWWGLLDQDQPPEDGSMTRDDFNSAPEIRQPTRQCIQSVRSSRYYRNLPQLDKNRLNRLNRLASGMNASGVPTFGSGEAARAEFRRRNPNLTINGVPPNCPS